MQAENKSHGISLKPAIEDYLFLKNKLYPEKGALKLVGDRYRLSGTERMILYRGVVSTDIAATRKKRIIVLQHPDHRPMLVDGYNVLFTLQNYMLGKQLFISNDGLLRDCGAGYPSLESPVYRKKFDKMVTLLTRFLACMAPQAGIYLDNPVDGSRAHQRQLQHGLEKTGAAIHMVPSADKAIINDATDKNIIVTSDSGIIDAAHNSSIYDAARHILERNFQVKHSGVKNSGVEWLNLEHYI